jgi:hypothetical protein
VFAAREDRTTYRAPRLRQNYPAAAIPHPWLLCVFVFLHEALVRSPKFRLLVDAIWRLRVPWVELYCHSDGFNIERASPLSDSADALAIYSRLENETGTGNFLFKNVSEFMEKV